MGSHPCRTLERVLPSEAPLFIGGTGGALFLLKIYRGIFRGHASGCIERVLSTMRISDIPGGDERPVGMVKSRPEAGRLAKTLY